MYLEQIELNSAKTLHSTVVCGSAQALDLTIDMAKMRHLQSIPNITTVLQCNSAMIRIDML